MSKIAVLPSNQHLNDYAGIADRKITEQYWAVIASQAAIAEFERQGQTAKMFWTPGTGSKSTDELDDMLRACVTWKPDLVVSIHSDWDQANHRDVFNQIRSEKDRAWGDGVGKLLAERLGFGWQYSAVRGHNLMFYYYDGMTSLRALLLEIGSHDSKADSEFNMKYATYEGIMAARCFLLGSGIALRSDGRVPKGVAVPGGQEKWAYSAGVGMPRLEVTWRQQWRFTAFLSDPMPGYAEENPINYLEWKLRKRYPERKWGDYRGVYDGTLRDDVRTFQKDTGLPVDGIMKDADWAVLRAPGAP